MLFKLVVKIKKCVMLTKVTENPSLPGCKPLSSDEVPISVRERFYTKSSSNTIFGIVSTILAVGLTAIIMPVIVVRFGADNWARYAFFLLYVAVLSFVESALQMYSLQRTATANSTMTSYYWLKDKQILVVFCALLILGGVGIGLNETSGLMQDSDLSKMLMLAFVNVFPRGASSVMKGAMLGLNNQMRYYVTTTLLNLSRPLYLLLILLFFQPSLVNLVFLYVIFSFAEVVIYLLLYESRQSTRIFPTTTKEVDMHLLVILLLSCGMSVIAVNLDKILVFTFVSLTLASEYTFASSVASLLYMFANVAIAAYGPKVKELFLNDDLQEMRRHLYGISFINNFVVMLAIAAFYFAGDYLLMAMSSNLDTSNVMKTFLVLSAACLMSSNLWIPGIFATSMGQASFNVKANLLFMATYIVVFYSIDHQAGQQVFALSMLLASVVTTTVGMVYFKFTIFQVSISRYVIALFIFPFVLVGILVLPLWWLDVQFKSLWVNLGYMAAISVVGGVIWWLGGDSQKPRLRALLVNL